MKEIAKMLFFWLFILIFVVDAVYQYMEIQHHTTWGDLFFYLSGEIPVFLSLIPKPLVFGFLFLTCVCLVHQNG